MAQAIHFVFRFDALIQGDMLVEVKAVIDAMYQHAAFAPVDEVASKRRLWSMLHPET
jgi:hypothetical protein